MTKLRGALFGCLILLALPSGAGAKQRDWPEDVQSFKKSAINAYMSVDLYRTNTEANLYECDSALETEQAGGATPDTWYASDSNANEFLSRMGPNAHGGVRIMISAVKDFTPWRGPGRFVKGKEGNFDKRADSLLRDAYHWHGPVNTLDLANTFVLGHDCGGARAQVNKATTDLDLERKVLYYQFNKVKAWVNQWVRP